MEWVFCFGVRRLLLYMLVFLGWVGVGSVGRHLDSVRAHEGEGSVV